MELPSIRESCKPRPEILEREAAMEQYAARLQHVVEGKADPIYKEPAAFFNNTYPTKGLKETIKAAFGRLSGDPGAPPVIQLTTGLGGGKTHTLIALYHLGTKGGRLPEAAALLDGLEVPKTEVIALEGDNIPLRGPTYTLWGALAKALGTASYELVKSDDKEKTIPDSSTLRKLFDPEKKYLILLDEVALYLRRASSFPVGDTNLAEQTATFLQVLSTLCGEVDNVTLVVTQLDSTSVYSERTAQVVESLKEAERIASERAIKTGREVLSRLVFTQKPVQGEDFGAIVRHRLFATVDEKARDQVCKEYANNLRDASVKPYVPSNVQEAEYLEAFRRNYPFHPELMSILRQKLSTIQNFNRTRGVLRLLARVVKDIWDSESDTWLVHPYHVDIRKQRFRDEVLDRLEFGHLNGAVEADIYNEEKGARAMLVDQAFQQTGEPLGTQVAITAFLHSLVSQGAEGVKRGESDTYIHAAMAKPGLDQKLVQNALDGLVKHGFHFHESGGLYYFSEHANLNKVVETEMDRIEDPQIWSETQERIRAYYGGAEFFELCPIPNDPSDVADNMEQVKLCVMHFNEATVNPNSSVAPELVTKIYDYKAGGKFRDYKNNLVFLVCDTQQKEHMFQAAKRYLALRQLHDRQARGEELGLGEAQVSRLKSDYQEAELYLRVAIVTAYRHLFTPSSQAQIDGGKGLRHRDYKWNESQIKNRHSNKHTEQRALMERLVEVDAALDPKSTKGLAPDFVLSQFWKNKDKKPTLPADEFQEMFFRTSWKLQFNTEHIKKAIERGVQEGRWFVLQGDSFHHTKNAGSLNVFLRGDTKIVIAESDDGQVLLEQHTAPKEPARAPPEKVGRETKGTTLAVEPPKGTPIVRFDEKTTMKRIGEELLPSLKAEGIEHVARVQIELMDRESLIKMLTTFPQWRNLGKPDLRFRVNMKQDDSFLDPPGDRLDLEFEGGPDGIQALSNVWKNYQAQNQDVQVTGTMEVTFTDPIEGKDLAELLGGFVADVAMTAPYKLRVEGVLEEAA